MGRNVNDIISEIVLKHSQTERTYDPNKRREYYLRTRKLKGRKPASPKISGVKRAGDFSKPMTPRPPSSGREIQELKKGADRARSAQASKLIAERDRLRKLLTPVIDAMVKYDEMPPGPERDAFEKKWTPIANKAVKTRVAWEKKVYTAGLANWVF